MKDLIHICFPQPTQTCFHHPLQPPLVLRLKHKQGRGGNFEEHIFSTEKRVYFKNCNFKWPLKELIEIEGFFPQNQITT